MLLHYGHWTLSTILTYNVSYRLLVNMHCARALDWHILSKTSSVERIPLPQLPAHAECIHGQRKVDLLFVQACTVIPSPIVSLCVVSSFSGLFWPC